MPTSDRIILTDVDGVLLEWESHFTKWMISRGYKLKENYKSEYDMGKRFVYYAKIFASDKQFSEASNDIKIAILKKAAKIKSNTLEKIKEDNSDIVLTR